MIRQRCAYTVSSLAILLASATLASMPAAAQDVGAAAAVNPQSQGTPPGREARVLRIGERVVHNERVQTSASGTVQILFIDKTTLNVGPNSNLVIDSFVFNPAAGTGQMVTTLTKGALRFVGGQLSHQGAATLKTPVATIGIRGGIATIAHGSQGTRAINDFGRLTIANGYGTNTIRRTGFAVTVAKWMSPPAEPQRVSQAETNFYLALLTSKEGQSGGARSLPTDARVSQFEIGDETFGPDFQAVQQQTTTVENVVFDIIVQGTQKGTVRPVQPPSQQQPPPPCSGGIC
ncbi:MAG: FecR domain-containing protein [Beijerinckiaceae bacterium]|nr:FecR domain-containing protein [Beijerinckiaceae bacterium]MCI0735136.1 FecR domain-containing protein [Beijerinckiaceae bacterium]